MTKIDYKVGNETGVIYWSIAEEFNELAGRKFQLDNMEAKEIVKLQDISDTAKILLSAVAGAVIQRLIDNGTEASQIFNEGKFHNTGEAKWMICLMF